MTLFAWLFNSPMEIALLVLVAVLLFGTRKLPELGRSLGKGIVEFKKGIKGIEDDVESTPSRNEQAEAPRPPQRIGGGAPKFDDQTPAKDNQPRSN
jgi:sec-independent protein translocase protein TatA